MTVMENMWAVPKAVFSSWGSSFVGRYDKLLAYGLVVGMALLSLMDCILDWSNYEELADPDYQYGLATGPAKLFPLDCLLWFNIVGSVLFVMEIINCLTLMCNGGHTKMPIEVEQTIVLVLEEIPQAAANLAIVMCRNNALMSQQTLTCVVALINSVARLYFYGWAKERWFKFERSSNKMTLKIGIYTSATMLWSFLLFTQIFMWHHARIGHQLLFNDTAKYSLLSGVSIFLLNHGTYEFPNTKVYNFSIDYMIHDQGLSLDKPWLVKDIVDIVADIDLHHPYYYPCKIRQRRRELDAPPIKPSACKGSDALKFLFKHEHKPWILQRHPLGEIKYNFAKIKHNGTTETCKAAHYPLESTWDLYYLIANLYTAPSKNETEAVYVSSPWTHACVTPSVNYDQHIDVCAG